MFGEAHCRGRTAVDTNSNLDKNNSLQMLIRIRTYICMYANMYICTYVHTYVYVYTYVRKYRV